MKIKMRPVVIVSHGKQCKPDWSDPTSLKYWKKKLLPRMQYPLNIHFKNEGEKKTFPRYTKSERIQYQQTCIIRKIKEEKLYQMEIWIYTKK